MDKIDHLMAENKENNKGSQKGQVTPKQYIKNNASAPIRLTTLHEQSKYFFFTIHAVYFMVANN